MADSRKAAVAIIAGGETAGTELEGAGATLKALIDVGGQPMVARVVRAARSAASVGRILVLGPQVLGEAVAAEGAELQTPAEATFLANLQAAAETLSDHPLILVSSCDIPLVTAEGLDDFIRKGLSSGAEFCYSIVSEAAIRRDFPQGERTLVPLRDGTFTGGNGVLVTPAFLKREGKLIERTFEARKSKVQLLRILGLPFVIRFYLRQLTIEMLERRVSEILKCSAKAIVSEDPGLAFDVDKMSDLEAVRAHVARDPRAA